MAKRSDIRLTVVQLVWAPYRSVEGIEVGKRLSLDVGCKVGPIDGEDVCDDVGYAVVATMVASWELVLVPKLGCSLITQKVVTLDHWLVSMLGVAGN